MKIAIISDIHSNIYALMRVLEDIEDQKADSIICLGDLVGYGPHPNETINLIKRRNILCIKGNYDVSVVNENYKYIRETTINSFSIPWTVSELRASNKYYLEHLPNSLTLEFNNKKIRFVHGSPKAINDYLFEDSDNTVEIMDNLKEDILVCAHTHLPFSKKINNKLLVNCGSIGKPKYGKPKATYCILTIDNNGNVSSDIREVDYEYKRIIKDMEILKFPPNLIRSYETGIE